MQLTASPEWLPFDFVEPRDGVRFLKLGEAEFAQASFLDQRIVTASSEFAALSWADVRAGSPPSSPRHYIFHIGHVGSTLLARLVGGAPAIFSLREPAILRALAAQEPADGDRPPLAEQMRLISDLLSRTFRKDQTAVVKATSFVSDIGPRLLEVRADAKAILMAVAPDVYMASILGGPNSTIELKAMARARAARLAKQLDVSFEPDTAPLGVLAAMSWLCETASLARMANERPAACLWVNFETFLQEPEEGLQRVFRHIGVDLEETALRDIVGGPLMRLYSKDTQHAYDRQTRRSVIDTAQRQHGEEIRAGMAWLNRVGASAPKARTCMQAAALGLRQG